MKRPLNDYQNSIKCSNMHVNEARRKWEMGRKIYRNHEIITTPILGKQLKTKNKKKNLKAAREKKQHSSPSVSAGHWFQTPPHTHTHQNPQMLKSII